MMSDDDNPVPFYAPHQPPAPPRQPKPGELAFEFFKDSDRYRVELRDYGGAGCEAQVFTNGELWQACRLPDRAWTTQWAERVRAEVLKGQHAWP